MKHDAYISLAQWEEGTDEIEVSITATNLTWPLRLWYAWSIITNPKPKSWGALTDRRRLIGSLNNLPGAKALKNKTISPKIG